MSTVIAIVLLLMFAAPTHAQHLLAGNGDSVRRLDVAILGSGFTEQPAFAAAVDKLVGVWFATEPFAMYQQAFNIWRIDGAHDFGCRYGCPQWYPGGNGPERLLCCDDNAVSAVLLATMPGERWPNIRVVLHNAPEYGASGGFVIVSSLYGGDFERAVLHELGHQFAALADEYSGATPGGWCQASAANVTQSPPRDNWLAHIEAGTAGVFEGACYADTGWWRGTDNSIMRNLDAASGFGPVSAERIAQLIDDHVPPMRWWEIAPRPMPIGSATPMRVECGDTFRVPLDDVHSYGRVRWDIDGLHVGGGETLIVDGTFPRGKSRLHAYVCDTSPMLSTPKCWDYWWEVEADCSRCVGDVTQDGTVSALDAVRVQRAVVQLEDATAAERVQGDVTGNGSLSGLDASLMLQARVGLINVFPTGPICGREQDSNTVPPQPPPPMAVSSRVRLSTVFDATTGKSVTLRLLASEVQGLMGMDFRFIYPQALTLSDWRAEPLLSNLGCTVVAGEPRPAFPVWTGQMASEVSVACPLALRMSRTLEGAVLLGVTVRATEPGAHRIQFGEGGCNLNEYGIPCTAVNGGVLAR